MASETTPAASERTLVRLDQVLEQPLTVAGHELRLFVESPPLVAAMVADIARAQRRVWLESYIFAADQAGQAVSDALRERARAGVDVRVVYDAIGSYATPTGFFTAMQADGVQVQAHHTLWDVLRRRAPWRALNHRNHRKLLVVDDDVAYFGGMNVVDQSAGSEQQLPPSAGWRDLHIRLVGPQQAAIAHNMDRLWHRMRREWRAGARGWANRGYSQDGQRIELFDSRPGFRRSRAVKAIVRLIRRARRQIVISMAYFIPTGRILSELVKASHRGVLIRVIVPAKSDVPIVRRASRYGYQRLLRNGLRIFERQDAMLHGKVMVVDEEWTMVGSCNLDPRSLWINREFFAIIRSRALAQRVRQVCAYELRHSKPVHLADCVNQSWWQRLCDRFAWSFRRWL